MPLPLDLKNVQALVRRLILAEVLAPPGQPGPLEPPPAARRTPRLHGRRSWVMTRRLPRSGRR